jgi:hypothetical protein
LGCSQISLASLTNWSLSPVVLASSMVSLNVI